MHGAKQALATGDVAVGAWLLSGSSRAAETLSRTAIDWIGIDTEHAPYSPERVEGMIRAVERQATPLIRLASVDAAIMSDAARALDAGAGGIIVPGVESAADAEKVVQATRFPPDGNRGVAGTVRANAYGQNFDAYVATANEETLVVLQIESLGGVERIDEILAVDGVDVAFIGENDLSSALGCPGEHSHPDVQDAVSRVFEAARMNDISTGIAARTPEIMDKRIERGFQFFLLGADLTFMRNGIQEFLSR